MTLSQILYFLLWNGLCTYLLVLSVLSTIHYQHDYDRYQYYYHQYLMYHHQDDYDQVLFYYHGYLSYVNYMLLDLFLGSILFMSLLSGILHYLENRNAKHDDYYPLASASSAV